MTASIRIVVAALGGEGGGVLAKWIADMADREGYLSQSTSVPGVAQRTGATIYYIEIFPRDEAEAAGGRVNGLKSRRDGKIWTKCVGERE